MPIYEYECPLGHRFEMFFKSFSEARLWIGAAPCPTCTEWANRVVSKPLLPHLYGDPAGYDHPSPTKRHSTRLASAEGNDNAIG